MMNYSSRVAFDHWRWGNHNRSLVFSKKHLVQLEKMIDPIKTIYIQVPKLDDGWPESVEEQSLLLLVWRHDITR